MDGFEKIIILIMKLTEMMGMKKSNVFMRLNQMIGMKHPKQT